MPRGHNVCAGWKETDSSPAKRERFVLFNGSQRRLCAPRQTSGQENRTRGCNEGSRGASKVWQAGTLQPQKVGSRTDAVATRLVVSSLPPPGSVGNEHPASLSPSTRSASWVRVCGRGGGLCPRLHAFASKHTSGYKSGCSSCEHGTALSAAGRAAAKPVSSRALAAAPRWLAHWAAVVTPPTTSRPATQLRSHATPATRGPSGAAPKRCEQPARLACRAAAGEHRASADRHGLNFHA